MKIRLAITIENDEHTKLNRPKKEFEMLAAKAWEDLLNRIGKGDRTIVEKCELIET